ncbi:hypothetical protein GOQ27_14460 [Clostridium sp. D2Q-11]|uniref:Bypass of forespore C C-terminal domain-containing protein n=1 Tax=Anaeromonas frigoriresistens TaxID=2683708 RepID=A0A942UV57_9FIRM|nr:hypothetical protein [Anaeromonas frigoriresistens]MBS4539673.1 hypothetical protein [Anaeromonas frigoriresistens]
MKNSSKIFYLSIGLIFSVVVLVFTILEIGFDKNSNDNITKENEENESMDELLTTEINGSEGKEITEDTIIEYDIFYTKCEHNIRDFQVNKNDYIGMNRKALEDSFDEESNKEVLKFDSNRVVIKQVKDSLCPDHYIVGENEGKVAIYKIDENGDRVLFKTLEQSIQLLGEYDKERLRNGIVVDDLDDIGEVIENFIS